MFNRVKRLLAAYIDFYICVFIACFFAAIPILIIPNVSKTSVLPISIYLIAFFTSAICKDKLFKNQSIGKKILKMRVVKDNGKDLCAVDILKRGLTLILLPLEILFILVDNRRIGDMWAGTTVVEV